MPVQCRFEKVLQKDLNEEVAPKAVEELLTTLTQLHFHDQPSYFSDLQRRSRVK